MFGSWFVVHARVFVQLLSARAFLLGAVACLCVCAVVSLLVVTFASVVVIVDGLFCCLDVCCGVFWVCVVRVCSSACFVF